MSDDTGAVMNFLYEEITGNLKIIIREAWHTIKTGLPEQVVSGFASLHESELEKYYPGIALCVFGDILAPDGELYSRFTDIGVQNRQIMAYLIIREWHGLLQEEKYAADMEALYRTADESLMKMIMGLWTDIKKAAFKEKGSLTEFRNAKCGDLANYHFGLGLYLRNTILTADSDLYLKFIDCGISERDEMSSAMIRVWHTALQKEN